MTGAAGFAFGAATSKASPRSPVSFRREKVPIGTRRSTDQRPQRRIVLDDMQLLDQAIETPNVTGSMRHQVDEYCGVNEVEVDDEAEMILHVRPLQVREIVDDHQKHGEWRR